MPEPQAEAVQETLSPAAGEITPPEPGEVPTSVDLPADQAIGDAEPETEAGVLSLAAESVQQGRLFVPLRVRMQASIAGTALPDNEHRLPVEYSFKPGDVVDLSIELANAWSEAGLCVIVKS